MKKFAIIFLLVISIFSVSKIDVRAEVFKSSKRFDDKKTEVQYLDGQQSYASCDGVFTPEAIELIKEVLGMIRIFAPCLVALLVALDFGSAVISNDNDGLSKATKKVVPRLIAAVLLLIVPTLIRIILSIDGLQSILVGDDPLCKTMMPATTDINNYI